MNERDNDILMVSFNMFDYNTPTAVVFRQSPEGPRHINIIDNEDDVLDLYDMLHGEDNY